MAELAGPSTDVLTDLAKFNHEVERVAKLMCLELGLQPIAMVRAPRVDMMTPGEHATHKERWPEETVLMHNWESYRRQAAISLAAFRAINKYILSET